MAAKVILKQGWLMVCNSRTLIIISLFCRLLNPFLGNWNPGNGFRLSNGVLGPSKVEQTLPFRVLYANLSGLSAVFLTLFLCLPVLGRLLTKFSTLGWAPWPQKAFFNKRLLNRKKKAWTLEIRRENKQTQWSWEIPFHYVQLNARLRKIWEDLFGRSSYWFWIRLDWIFYGLAFQASTHISPFFADLIKPQRQRNPFLLPTDLTIGLHYN